MTTPTLPRQVTVTVPGDDSPSGGDAGPVVVYDSGIGGLTVARHLVARWPGEDIAYVADNGWFPYGDKGDIALRARIYAILNAVLATTRPRAIVIACNTASTAVVSTLDDITDDVPVFTVVPPIEQAARRSPDGTIAVLATPNTLRRSLVRRMVERHAPSGRIKCLGSMALVHLAEAKLAGQSVSAAEVEAALAEHWPAQEREDVSGVVLGCTHFPWLVEELRPAFPAATAWSDPARQVVDHVVERLTAQPRAVTGQGTRTLYLTSGHNSDALRRVFARHGFFAGRHLSLGWDAYAPSLRTG